jgi:hypothetical protein
VGAGLPAMAGCQLAHQCLACRYRRQASSYRVLWCSCVRINDKTARRRFCGWSTNLLVGQLVFQVVNVHTTFAEAFITNQIPMQGMLVLMPSTTISSRALRIRAMASSRVAPQVISLPISES